jgi:hypothetical protein
VANKTGNGGFKAGASGNPGGRPKAASVIAIEARKHGLAMVGVLNTIARKGRSEQARISAAVALLDRGYGRPSQSVELNFHADLLQKRLLEMTPEELHILEERTIQISATDYDDSEPGLPLGSGGYNGGGAADDRQTQAWKLSPATDRQNSGRARRR